MPIRWTKLAAVASPAAQAARISRPSPNSNRPTAMRCRRLIDPTTGRLHTSFHQALDRDRAAELHRSQSAKHPDSHRGRPPYPARLRRRSRDACCSRPITRRSSCACWPILSGDPTLIDAFRRGEDIHARTAPKSWGVKPDEVDAEARRLAKVINFGIIYGMGPQRLAGELGIRLKEASEYIKRYFERLPGVHAYLEDSLRRRASGDTWRRCTGAGVTCPN